MTLEITGAHDSLARQQWKVFYRIYLELHPLFRIRLVLLLLRQPFLLCISFLP